MKSKRTKIGCTSVPGLVKRGDFFWGRVSVGGKEFKRSLGTDFQTARDALGPWRREVQLRAGAGIVVDRSLTVGDCLTALQTRVDQDPTLSANHRSYVMYRTKMLLRTWEGLGDMHPKEVTTDKCRDWVARVSVDRGASSVYGSLESLRNALDIAVDKGAIAMNPARLVKSKQKATTLAVDASHELSREDFVRIVEKMREIEEHRIKGSADLATLLALTGVRHQQAVDVVWGDVDFARGFIKLPHSKRRASIEPGPRRHIPFYPKLRSFLEELRTRSTSTGPSDKVIVVGSCRKSLRKACEELGFPRLHHHDLRHMFSTWAIEATIDIPAVADLLGHKDGGALLMRTYRHLRPAHLANVVQKLG